MHKIKIAFIITNLSTGGAENMLFKLLQQLDRSRFCPLVISLVGMGEFGPRIKALGIPVHAMGMSRGWLNPLILLRLIQLLRRFRPNIVHTWMYHADLLGGLAARWAGIKRVVWCIRHSNLAKTENKRTTLWVVKACALLSHRVPMQIVSCSHQAKRAHIAVGYAKEKLHVIPNGFDLTRFVPEATARESVRRELDLSTDALLVGLVARFDSQKNHLGFIQAAAKVHTEIPSAHFLLIGAEINSQNTALTAAIDANGLHDQVHLLDRRDDIPRLMASLDVLASSSHGEAFPNVLGEAMACGVCCVVTDVGDSAEIVGDTGYVVPARDMAGLARGIVTFLRKPLEEKLTLGAQARVRVAAHYEIGGVTRQYENLYNQVAADEKNGDA